MERSQLILYRSAMEDTLQGRLALALERAADGERDDALREELASLTEPLLSLAAKEGLEGNLLQALLCRTLLLEENAWSLACEGRGDPGGSLGALARREMAYFRKLFSLDLSPLRELLGMEAFEAVTAFDFGDGRAESDAAEAICALREAFCASRDAEEMAEALAEQYRRGVGLFAFHRAFRVTAEGGLAPAECRSEPLSALIGYEAQKKALVENTAAFLAGRSANHVLLYGDAGTGKSTSVRSLLTEFRGSPLRLVELGKDSLFALTAVAEALGRRRCRFLLLLDDLSFEEHETAYKQLKAAIEGGLAPLPENVLLVATSNRRHLVREVWSDRSDMEHDGDVHRSDTMEEKLSLAGRFGLKLFFPNPTFEEYQTIVGELASRHGVHDPALREAAAKWQVRGGSRSGRSARQFVDDYLQKAAGQES